MQGSKAHEGCQVEGASPSAGCGGSIPPHEPTPPLCGGTVASAGPLPAIEPSSPPRQPTTPPSSAELDARARASGGLWLRGRWHERPPSGHCDGLSHLEWAHWLDTARNAVEGARNREGWRGPGPSPRPARDPGDAFAGRQTLSWTEATGWRRDDDDEGAAAPPSSFLDNVGTSRQTTVITRHSARAVATLAELAAVTAAFRGEKADRCDQRARAADALSTRRWWRSRAGGWRQRMQTAAECGTRAVWLASCGGCDAPRRPAELRCGLARECPTCRGRELGARQETITRRMDAAKRARARECARHGPTVARPLGPWAWRMVSLTIPPGAGVGRDASDIRDAFARLMRRLDRWLKVEGQEANPSLHHSSVEGTPGVDRDGHVHIHALILSPYIPHALLRRWWGEILAKKDRRRVMPYRCPEDATEGIKHAATRRLVTHTMRGRCGRQLKAIPWPVLDVRAADEGSIRELAKYAVKGIETPNAAELAAWADVYCALSTVRLYASSRRLASLVEPVKPIEHLSCESCGLVGEWNHRTQSQRGPPEGARVMTCRAIIGLA